MLQTGTFGVNADIVVVKHNLSTALPTALLEKAEDLSCPKKGGWALRQDFGPMSAEKALAVSIGENALWKIGTDGLHAIAVSMQDDGTCELIVVPEATPTMEDILEWEFETGELRLLFHAEADIELRLMDQTQYHALAASEEPAFNRHLAEA